MNTSESNIDYKATGGVLSEVKIRLDKLEEYVHIKRFRILQISIGIIYFWFGALKFFHGISPAESLAVDTLGYLSAGLVSDDFCLFVLAIWETLIGVMLICNMKKRYVILAALLHLIGTFSPMFIMPDEVFNSSIFTLSLTGQYIVKNLIIFSSLLVLYPAEKYAGK